VGVPPIRDQRWRQSTGKYAIGQHTASELTLFGSVYDLAAAEKMAVIGKTAAPGRLLDDAETSGPLSLSPTAIWLTRSRSVPYRRRRWPQSTRRRLNRDWLSRTMSDLAGLRAHAQRYREAGVHLDDAWLIAVLSTLVDPRTISARNQRSAVDCLRVCISQFRSNPTRWPNTFNKLADEAREPPPRANVHDRRR
jgi:hypothetical protein